MLVDIYLKALLSTFDYNKAYIQSENLKVNIKSDLKKIYPTLGQIYINVKKYRNAFEVYFSLLNDNVPNAQVNLDLLVSHVLDNGEFDLLYLCRENKNYMSIARAKLSQFYENEKYPFFIKLFEEDFESDYSLVKDYIMSLYANEGTVQKAYEKGKYYITKIDKPRFLSYYMGLICTSLNKWIEAYDYFKNCLSNSVDNQEDIDKLTERIIEEDIDKLIEKIIEKKEWSILAEFKDSLNYATKIEKTFMSLNDSNDYENIIVFYESLNFGISDRYKVKRYVYSLYNIYLSKSLIKYNEFNSHFSNDKYWFWIGGKINEANKQYETALNLFKKAEAIETGYCSDDVKRVNYLVNPEIHFKDLYDQEKYLESIEIFESKLNKTADIKLISSYISSLYRNKGTEEKAMELGVLYSKSNSEGEKLFLTIASIGKRLKKYTLAKEYLNKAQQAGYNVQEELQEINMIIAKAEEEERKRKEEEERKRKEEIERQRRDAERKKEEELERIRLQEIKDERDAVQRRKEKRAREERDAEEEEQRKKEEKAGEEQENSKIGSHEFKSSITRGGDAIFPEHIYVDDNEVTWEKKTGVFSKDSKTIPMKNITQIDIETSLIGAKIKIRSKGFGFIQGENFTKSDVKEIKSLIEKAQGNL